MAKSTQLRGGTLPDWLKGRRRAVGEALAAFRKDRGYSQEGLASMAGIATMTLGRIERGESGSDESYRKIAEALKLPCRPTGTSIPSCSSWPPRWGTGRR